MSNPVKTDEMLHESVVASLTDDLAQDIVSIDLAGQSAIADYMVIATGRSSRHVGALADRLLRKLKRAGVKGVRQQGRENCDWVLLDVDDVVVHIFRAEVRDFYGIEKIWNADAPTKQTEMTA